MSNDHLCCSRCGMPVAEKATMPAYYEYQLEPGKKRPRLSFVRQPGWLRLADLVGYEFRMIQSMHKKVGAYRTLRSWLRAIGIETKRGPVGPPVFNSQRPNSTAWGSPVRWFLKGGFLNDSNRAVIAAKLIMQMPDRKLARSLFIAWAHGRQAIPPDLLEDKPQPEAFAIEKIERSPP